MADLDSTVDDPNLTESFRPVAHPEWSASRPVRVTHVGAVSGVVWGLIVVGILKLSIGGGTLHVVATSLLVSSVIGMAASRAVWPIRSRSLLIRGIASGVLLYAAGALYGFANFGLESFDPDQGTTGIIEKVHVALIGAAVFPYGMTITGIVLVLWPLAFANCVMVWRIEGNASARPE